MDDGKKEEEAVEPPDQVVATLGLGDGGRDEGEGGGEKNPGANKNRRPEEP